MIIMSLIQWWNSLGMAAQIFYCIAIPSTLILIIQTVMMFLGMSDDGDASEIDGDISSDTEIADDLPDVDEGVFGDNTVSEASDAWGLEGLRIFTVRGIIAFLVVFGWVGGLMDENGIKLYITIPVAFVCGFAMMVLLALLFRAVMRLRNDGNTDNRNAIGVSGRVQLTIPPSRSGEGKVHLMLQGSYVERDAVTDEAEPIPTGWEVVVTKLSGQTTLVVRKK